MNVFIFGRALLVENHTINAKVQRTVHPNIRLSRKHALEILRREASPWILRAVDIPITNICTKKFQRPFDRTYASWFSFKSEKKWLFTFVSVCCSLLYERQISGLCTMTHRNTCLQDVDAAIPCTAEIANF